MQIIEIDKDDDEELDKLLSQWLTVLGNIAEKGHFMAKMCITKGWARLLRHFKDGQTIREIFVPSHSVCSSWTNKFSSILFSQLLKNYYALDSAVKVLAFRHHHHKRLVLSRGEEWYHSNACHFGHW